MSRPERISGVETHYVREGFPQSVSWPTMHSVANFEVQDTTRIDDASVEHNLDKPRALFFHRGFKLLVELIRSR